MGAAIGPKEPVYVHNVLPSSFSSGAEVPAWEQCHPSSICFDTWFSCKLRPIYSGVSCFGILRPEGLCERCGDIFCSVATGRSWIVLPHVRLIDKAQGKSDERPRCKSPGKSGTSPTGAEYRRRAKWTVHWPLAVVVVSRGCACLLCCALHFMLCYGC